MNLIKLLRGALVAVGIGAAAAIGVASLEASPRPVAVAHAPRSVRVGNGTVVFMKLANGNTASRFYPNFVRVA